MSAEGSRKQSKADWHLVFPTTVLFCVLIASNLRGVGKQEHEFSF